MIHRCTKLVTAIAVVLISLGDAEYFRSGRKDDFSDRKLREPYYRTTELGDTNLLASVENPLKGLVPNPIWTSPPYDFPHSLEFYYVALDSVLVGPNEFDWTELENHLQASASRKKHAIVRFYIDYPGKILRLPLFLLEAVELEYYDVYGGGLSPNYADPDLLDVLYAFIDAFGTQYDGDNRLAFVQMGLLGFWGEWHTFGYDHLLPDETRNLVAKWFADAFPTTPLQTRTPLASSYKGNFGYHDDSYAYSTLDGKYNGGVNRWYYFWQLMIAANETDFWKRSVMGGEVRPEIKDVIFDPAYPARTDKHQSFTDCTEVTHATYMGHMPSFQGVNGKKRDNALYAHAHLGYNFKVEEVQALVPETSEGVDIVVKVMQIGNAPFYFDLNLVLDCNGLASPMTLGGIEELIEKYEFGLFIFRGIPATHSCLSAVSIALESSRSYSDVPIKFAQGIDGTVVVNIPVPEGETSKTAPPTPTDRKPQVPGSPPANSAVSNPQSPNQDLALEGRPMQGDFTNQRAQGLVRRLIAAFLSRFFNRR